jgi:inorganic pyrophosphatase
MRLDKLPTVDPKTGDTLAVVETPKGSRNKYDYDPELRSIRLAAVLPVGMVFPFDFGFFPSTRADDGDPVDVLILMDESATPGCVLSVRVIGAIEAEQRKKDAAWVRNDRVLAVASHSHAHARVHSIEEFDPATLNQIEAFFTDYNRLKAVEFRVIRHAGPKQARKTIDRYRA